MFFGKKKVRAESQFTDRLTLSKSISSSQISTENLAEMNFLSGTALVIAFVSPHLDFNRVSQQLTAAIPYCKHIISIMTSGELGGQVNLYHPTSESWDNIVIHAFSAAMIKDVSV